MRLALLYVLVGLTASGCGSAAATIDDRTSPSILLRSPTGEAPTDAPIALVFNEAIRVARPEAIALEEGAGTEPTRVPVTLSVEGSRLRLTPTRPLAPGTLYAVSLDSCEVSDHAGNSVALRWSWRTSP